jgi:hypothetical protein
VDLVVDLPADWKVDWEEDPRAVLAAGMAELQMVRPVVHNSVVRCQRRDHRPFRKAMGNE